MADTGEVNERRAYLERVVEALDGLARWVESQSPVSERERGSHEAAEQLHSVEAEIRARVQEGLVALAAPDDLQSFHGRMVAAIAGAVEDPPRAGRHGQPASDPWFAVLMELYGLCRAEGVEFPRRGQPAGQDDWRVRLRRAMQEIGHPEPDEAIRELERMRAEPPEDFPGAPYI